MPIIPEYMRKAVEFSNIAEVDDWRLDKEINELALRWGGLDVPTLQKIMVQHEVSQDDKLTALLAIIFAGQPESFAILQPYLQSSRVDERLMSALGLWETHRELSFSLLSQLLETNIVTSGEFAHVELFCFFNKWSGLLSFFSKWKDRRVISTLRHSLPVAFEIERQLVIDAHLYNVQTFIVEVLTHYQINVVFILGTFDAFGALTGLQMSEKRLRKLMLNLVLGSLMKETDVSGYVFLMDLEVKDSNPLYQTFAELLERQFGLTSSECQSYIYEFWADPFKIHDEFH